MEVFTAAGEYLSLALLASGLVAFCLGGRAEIAALRTGVADRQGALSMARGLRAAILGACVAGVGAGRYWGIDWLLALSLTMLAVETLEIAVVVGALRGKAKPRLWGRGAAGRQQDAPSAPGKRPSRGRRS